MKTHDAIYHNQSIRHFKDVSIPIELVEEILNAGKVAPSSKNSQPWHFVLIKNDSKPTLVTLLNNGLSQTIKGQGFLTINTELLIQAKQTIQIMHEAPLIIFIYNTNTTPFHYPSSLSYYLSDMVDIQSIGACIQNMTLKATSIGIGSLWIGDIYFAYQELSQWIDFPGQLVAAVAFGYPSKIPNPRPRKSLDTLITWK